MSDGECEVIVIGEEQDTCVKAMNYGASKATGDILVCISDDMLPCQDWDKLIIEELEKVGNTDFLLFTQDGTNGWICTLPILGREYYNRFGYIYNPEYKHLFADTEMSAVAIMTDKIIISDLVFIHNHFAMSAAGYKRDKDEFDKPHWTAEAWQFGEEIYNRHKADNFGVEIVDSELYRHCKNREWI